MTTEPGQFDEGARPRPPEIAPSPPGPPAVWPVFAIFVGAIVLCALSQFPVALAVVVFQVVQGGRPAGVLDFIQTPAGFIAFAIGPQLTLLAAWWLATTYGDPRCRRHRAIGASSLSVPAYACLMAATLAVFWLGFPLAELGLRLFGDWQTDTMFSKLYDHVTWPSGLALVVFIAVAPGFVEELFFRGYMQRRLLDRWRPAVVVPLVAVLFAAIHGTPAWSLGVLPLAFWLGLLAWRTASLWPGIVCHGFINGSVNLWRVGAAMEAWPSELSPALYYGGVAVCLVCLLISLWLLATYRPPSEPAREIEPSPAVESQRP